MDFTTIGKVGSYIRQKNLAFAANYKIKTGQRITNDNGQLSFAQSTMFDQIQKASKKSASEVKSARLASIKNKLMAGRKLSDEEMGYLRVNDKDLYKKAKHADDSREELKAELKGAKSKQEARQILTRAMVKASAEASAEIAACKSAASGGGSFTGGAASAGADIAVTGGEVPTGGDISMSTENISAGTTETENVSLNENSTTDSNSPNNNISDTESSDDGKNTVDGILEKFIMTIRALEDEWAHYVNSDEYKDLPENFGDGEKVYKASQVSSRKVFDAIFTYRQTEISMSNKFGSTDIDAWTNITLQQ